MKEPENIDFLTEIELLPPLLSMICENSKELQNSIELENENN